MLPKSKYSPLGSFYNFMKPRKSLLLPSTSSNSILPVNILLKYTNVYESYEDAITLWIIHTWGQFYRLFGCQISDPILLPCLHHKSLLLTIQHQDGNGSRLMTFQEDQTPNCNILLGCLLDVTSGIPLNHIYHLSIVIFNLFHCLAHLLVDSEGTHQ